MLLTLALLLLFIHVLSHQPFARAASLYSRQANPDPNTSASSPNFILELTDSVDLDATATEVAGIMAEISGVALAELSPKIQRIDIGTGASRFRALIVPEAQQAVQEGVRGRVKGESVKEIVAGMAKLKRRVVQNNAPIGLDRIDSRTGLDTRFNYPENAGSGVDIYILDSGCNAQHPDLAGRTTLLGGLKDDPEGHGTMVASMAAGTKYGVAKNATMMCVELDADNMLPAFQLAFTTMQQRKRPSVINMSSGIDDAYKNKTLLPELAMYERAINALVDFGAPFVASAGNQDLDTCFDFPSRILSVISVGATSPKDDTIADFSSRGECTTLFAPGDDVTGADARTGGEDVGSGTSFSSPLVAGAVAVLMGQGLDGDEATEEVVAMAARGVVKGDLRGSPNLHLFLNADELDDF